jgi:hypothetical protein
MGERSMVTLWARAYNPWLVCLNVRPCLCIHLRNSIWVGEAFDDTAAIVNNGIDDALCVRSLNMLDSACFDSHSQVRGS